MKFLISLVALAVLLVAAPAFAQNQGTPGSPVMQVGQRGDAAQYCDSAVGNLTLRTPGPGQSDYVVSISSISVASGVPTAATPTISTMTGIGGTSPSFFSVPSVFPAAGAQGSVWQNSYPLATPIKGTAGTAIVLVAVTAVTNFPTTNEVCYFIAP